MFTSQKLWCLLQLQKIDTKYGDSKLIPFLYDTISKLKRNHYSSILITTFISGVFLGMYLREPCGHQKSEGFPDPNPSPQGTIRSSEIRRISRPEPLPCNITSSSKLREGFGSGNPSDF